MLLGILTLGYWVPRAEFTTLFMLFTLVFAGMLFLRKSLPPTLDWKWIFFAGLILRVSLLFATPNWSEDYIRFLWDGDLLRNGINPYLLTPSQLEELGLAADNAFRIQLFDGLNSPDYYSVYPPLNQALFYIGAAASNGFVWNGFITLKTILILGEIGVFFVFLRIFLLLHIPFNKLIYYWLNPLVILEISNNLHFEGLVLLFLLGSFYFILSKGLAKSGFFWGISIGLKLLPLMLLPSFFSLGKIRKSYPFWMGTFLALILSFAWLMIDQSWINFFQSLKLYQGKFEFNASIYYLLREVGFWIQGYNTIATLTKILSGSILIGILYFSWKKRPKSNLELVDLWVLIYLIYLIFQPVVHPWYILPALGISLLTERKVFFIWSFAAIFSYQAYGNLDYHENPLFLLLEYGLVGAGIYLDYVSQKRNSNLVL
ncbi:glycosyltransferase 87 family protein [Algoriphagus marinus]|uniref:glycosyltransferase 87 family protein n=1 Tax=Algoriphagus marinus TaxID=1925762 RepID=UPI00094BB740|nr:glycosyltransferase 87 family protein [Algoriphagus marinus]